MTGLFRRISSLLPFHSIRLTPLPLLCRPAGPAPQLQPGEPDAGQPADRLRAGLQLGAAPGVPHGGGILKKHEFEIVFTQ